ncbi:MAG: MATE family efflux transporter [Lachnospiraceae bacterium]|nr:MATE family efflux transporter [Lachnospiraceae bacterium]
MNLFKNNSKEINEATPLLFLAGPMFLELLLNICINNVDTLMLSHYSETAVGAVGNANQVMFLLILMFNIIATATSVIVAQYLGAKQHEKMNTIYTLSVIVNLVMGIVLSLLFVTFKGTILGMLKVPADMVNEAEIYINIVGGGLFLQAVYNVMLQILRCNGYAKVGMYISIVINLINVVGNYLFLYGPLEFLKLGVAGAAIPTVFARLSAVVISIAFFYRKKIGKFAIKYITPFPGKMLLEMIKIGLPSAGENMFYNMYQLILLSFINGFGSDAVNAKVYCQSLIAFAMIFSNAAAMGTQIIVGHLVGAGKEDAAYRRAFATLKVSLPITIGLAIANMLLSPFTLRLFTSNQEIIHIGFFIMAVDIVIETGRCLNMTFVSSLKAAGDYIFPLVVGIITMYGLGVTVGYTMGVIVGFGVAGVFAGTAADEFIRGLIVMNRWRRKKWLGKAIVKSDETGKKEFEEEN